MDIDELMNQGEALGGSLKDIDDEWLSCYEYASHSTFQEWVQKTIRFLYANFSGDAKIEEFEELSNNQPSPKNHDKLMAVLKAYKVIPQPIIASDQVLHHDAIVINNTQNQSQQQSIVADVFKESVSDELTGKQMKELIAALLEDKDNKKGTITEKLKSFGLDTLSSIVSNIVTNPAVIAGILG